MKKTALFVFCFSVCSQFLFGMESDSSRKFEKVLSGGKLVTAVCKVLVDDPKKQVTIEILPEALLSEKQVNAFRTFLVTNLAPLVDNKSNPENYKIKVVCGEDGVVIDSSQKMTKLVKCFGKIEREDVRRVCPYLGGTSVVAFVLGFVVMLLVYSTLPSPQGVLLGSWMGMLGKLCFENGLEYKIELDHRKRRQQLIKQFLDEFCE